MKRQIIFPLSAKAFTVIVCSVTTVIFLLVFFLTPQPVEYNYVGTEIGEVIEVRPSKGNTSAVIQFDDSNRGSISFPTNRVILKGDRIAIDILEAEGEKPRYRLAQDPVQP